MRSEYFRDLLVAAALAAHEGNGYVSGAEELSALTHLDPAQAKPILERHAASAQPRLSVLATGLLFGILPDGPRRDRYRSRLQRIAESPTATGFARDLAVESLMAVPWDGRDAWYLALFRDPSLGSISDGTSIYSPLETPAHQDPERLLPLLGTLARSPDPTVRRNAAYVLVSFGHQSARLDALVPLLPWLVQPDWVHANDSGHHRRNLVYSLSLVPVPESIPGLSHLLLHPEEAETFEIGYAALALRQYQDHTHAPVLRQALERNVAIRERREVAEALLSTGALTLYEKLQSALTFLRYVADGTRRKHLAEVQFDTEGGEEIEGQVVLGWTLLCQNPKEVVAALRPYSATFRQTEPETAAMIDAALAILPDRTRDRRILSAIRTGAPTIADLTAALEHRAWLGRTDAAELESLAKASGTTAGIAAALLPTDGLRNRILEQGTQTPSGRSWPPPASHRVTWMSIWSPA